MAEEITAEIKDISYGSLLFRHIDRILSLANQSFNNDQSKLFTFKWSVKLLRTSIPDDVFGKKDKKPKEINDDLDYKQQFEQTQALFGECINLLANKGYLYRKVTDGEYDD